MKDLQKRLKFLNSLIGELDARKGANPVGSLRINKHKDQWEYYHVSPEFGRNGKYIKKADLDIARQLALKEYDMRVLKEAKAEKKAIEQFLHSYNEDGIWSLFNQMSLVRKDLIAPATNNDPQQLIIAPYELSDEEYARRWQAVEYPEFCYRNEEKVRETRRGEMVRTKSEEIIANIYYELGIPYRYEYPVTLKNGNTRHPDFVGLNVAHRKEVYHEHFGLLEDDAYLKHNLMKLREYESIGIVNGDNLIITFETSYCPLNTNELRKTLKKVFLQ